MTDKIKVLIADDFELLLEDMAEVISLQSDMEVVGTATNGKGIVALAKEVDFDLILMDIEMDTINDGIEATRLIRDDNNAAKIIFLTAHGTKDIIIAAMATGAVDYIVKGVAEDDIIQHIRSAHLGKPLMESKIQEIIMQEYKRLQQSEKSLLFFIHNLSDLTRTEREIIQLLLQGMKVREVAAARNVEIVTVKTQISGILRKFGETRTKAIIKKIRDLNISHLF